MLANSLFKIHGVQTVMLAARHVTVTKTSESEWELLQPNIELVMSQFFAAGLDVIDKDKIEYYEEGRWLDVIDKHKIEYYEEGICGNGLDVIKKKSNITRKVRLFRNTGLATESRL